MSSNSIRSLVKPLLHDGEQIDGGVGCRAAAGSGGTAGGATTGGGDGGELCAQALTSVSSSSGVSARALQVTVGFIGGFLHLGGATTFFLAGSLGRLPGLALQLGHLLGVLAPGLGMRGLLAAQAQRLQAGQQQGRGQGDGESTGGHFVTAFWATLPVM